MILIMWTTHGTVFLLPHFFLSNGRWLCDMMFYLLVEYILRSMGLCKKDVTPLLTHWSYVIIALTYLHEHVVCHRINFGKCKGVHHNVWSYRQRDWGFFCKKCKNKYIKHHELFIIFSVSTSAILQAVAVPNWRLLQATFPRIILLFFKTSFQASPAGISPKIPMITVTYLTYTPHSIWCVVIRQLIRSMA